MAKSKIALFDYNDNQVRMTEDRRFSVYDILSAFIEPTTRNGIKAEAINPRQFFKSITDNNSEVVHFCDNFKFPGRGQRETPVATEENIYQILMLCPGKRGAEFRKWVAGILADPEKAANYAITKWRKEGKSDEWIGKRLDGKLKRRTLTDSLKTNGIEKGFEYATCTNAIYVPLLGGTAQDIREARDIPKGKPTRDYLDELEVALVGVAELLATRSIEKHQLKGADECEAACWNAGSRTRVLLDED